MKDDPSQIQAAPTKYSLLFPLVVYGLSLLISALVLLWPALFLHGSKDYLTNHIYVVGTIGQLAMDLPAVFLFFRLKNKTAAPAKWQHRTVSLILGILLAMLLAGVRIFLSGKLMGGRFMGEVPAFTQSLSLPQPWNMLAAISALLAYGPGEAIFVVYLILAFDNSLGGQAGIFSRGVFITSILWALPHLFNIFFYGLGAIPNVLIMFFIGLLVGLLLKGTRSSWGPVIFWTLVNGTSF